MSSKCEMRVQLIYASYYLPPQILRPTHTVCWPKTRCSCLTVLPVRFTSRTRFLSQDTICLERRIFGGGGGGTSPNHLAAVCRHAVQSPVGLL
jgi:hypothetical protein